MDVKWIAVRDSLPTYSKKVLVKIEHENGFCDFAVGYLMAKGWRLSTGMLSVFCEDRLVLKTPTHWAYLR